MNITITWADLEPFHEIVGLDPIHTDDDARTAFDQLLPRDVTGLLLIDDDNGITFDPANVPLLRALNTVLTAASNRMINDEGPLDEILAKALCDACNVGGDDDHDYAINNFEPLLDMIEAYLDTHPQS